MDKPLTKKFRQMLAKKWRQLYRAASKELTFRQLLNLFRQQQGVDPPGDLPLMPANDLDWFRRLEHVPRERLRGQPKEAHMHKAEQLVAWLREAEAQFEDYIGLHEINFAAVCVEDHVIIFDTFREQARVRIYDPAVVDRWHDAAKAAISLMPDDALFNVLSDTWPEDCFLSPGPIIPEEHEPSEPA